MKNVVLLEVCHACFTHSLASRASSILPPHLNEYALIQRDRRRPRPRPQGPAHRVKRHELNRPACAVHLSAVAWRQAGAHKWPEAYEDCIAVQGGREGSCGPMRDGKEFMRFSELGGEPPLIDGHARRARRAPVHMIRKNRCVTVGQGQMIVVQYPESFEAGSTASGSF